MKTLFGGQTSLKDTQTRRGFLKAVGSLGMLLGTQPLWALGNSRSRLSPLEVKARIRGPILTLPTPFTADFKVDHQGVRNLVKLGLANGIGVYEMTFGN